MNPLQILLDHIRSAWAAYRYEHVRDAEGLTADDRHLIAWVALLKATEPSPLF